MSKMLIIVGFILLLLSIFADTLGIGGGASFGYRQIIGVVFGIIMVVIGIVLNKK